MRLRQVAKEKARSIIHQGRSLWNDATQPLIGPLTQRIERQKLIQIRSLTRIKSVVLAEPFKRGCQKLVLFSHYSALGQLQRCIQREITALIQDNWDVVLISTNLNHTALQWCKEHQIGVVLRRNEGRDFGAFQDGWLWLKRNNLLSSCKKLILLNDSVYPIINLNESSWPRFLEGNPNSVVGFTDSYENGYHLQSYALHLPQVAIQSEWLNHYWNHYLGWGGMQRSIRSGEIGLSQLLLQHGMRLEPLHSVINIRAQLSSKQLSQNIHSRCSHQASEWILAELLNSGNSSISNFSPMHRWAIPLILDGCPFIKRQLLENNEGRFIDPILIIGNDKNLMNPDELTDYLKPPILYFFG